MNNPLLPFHADHLPPTTIMEVCGTHTQSIARYGIKQLLPPSVRLVSGPGCPVCVTDEADLRRALALARMPGVTMLTFGDMLRVPSAQGDSLLHAREQGADVRLALSPSDALALAQTLPARQIVWFAVGFETTAPLTAVLVKKACAMGLRNLSVLCTHKTMPAALKALLKDDPNVQALLCPGHVAAITGSEAFRFVPRELGMPAVVSGFSAREVLSALSMLLQMRVGGETALGNAYPTVVTAEGNASALRLMDEVFIPCDASWRGLGRIPGSGLALRPEFSQFDASLRFPLPQTEETAAEGPCRCAAILRGAIGPKECPCFGRACTPQSPMGPCMVSSEGACSIAFQFGDE